ncbi:MAG: asparagine synthase (glutamine-hydrolyzing) [Deltaproteobacteria bacterium]|nr:asparagine synthase (glutamine-hydrolyzing) [Deltaproteobacteria bacterium]
MCGITGFIDLKTRRSPEELEAVVRAMAEALHHRGPDDSGVWVDAALGLALGHRRLSILDLSPLGRQPMVSPGGRYLITYNGEIYNFPTLRQELESQGQKFRSTSDTEVMLAAIDRWGLEEALPRFIGMFAFALWDREERVLFLARDRLGEKPLYYGWQGKVFIFGSELKALRRWPDFSGVIDRNALALFLRLHSVPAPYSIYQGIHKLLPGTFLRLPWKNLTPGEVPTPLPYWSAREVAEQGQQSPFPGNADEAIDELERLLKDAVRNQMLADVPLGALLSGGLDSSTVVALMQTQSSRPVKTFTIGFHEDAFNEAVHARAVARHLGTDHTELYVTAAVARGVIPQLAELYGEPFGDSSQIPTSLVCRLARSQVTVALSGDGGDELFGGYPRYTLVPEIWRLVNRIPPGWRRITGKFLTGMPVSFWDRLLTVLEPFLPPSLRVKPYGEKIYKLAEYLNAGSPEDVYYRLISQWQQPLEVVRGAEEYPTVVTDQSRWASLPDLVQRLMYFDLGLYLPDDILVKVDRAAMGVSLETRVPLLDHRVVEFAWRLPLSLKIRNCQGKWLLRELLCRYVPRELVERPKMGFAVPLAAWLTGPLRDWAESLLAEPRLRQEGFFHPEPIRRKWREHLTGKPWWHHHLWNILMFQAWLEASGGSAV